MPPWQDEDEWTLVQSRRGRRRERIFERYGPPNRRAAARFSSYPRRDERRSYAEVTREGTQFLEPNFYSRQQVRRRPAPQPFYDGQRYLFQDGAQPAPRPRRGPSNQNGRYVFVPADARNAAPPHRVQSDDPDFTNKVRVMNRLIKAVHHLSNVSREDHPPSLDRITHNLATIIKPAAPNLQTQTLIDGNARNWAFTTILILREHYQKNIDSEIHKLMQFPSPDWRGPFEIATTWAKRNLGRRLRQDTLDRAQAVIIARLTEPAPPPPAAAPPPLSTQAADQTSGEDPHAVIELASSPPPANQPLSTRPQSPAVTRPPIPPQSSGHQITTIAQVHAPPPPTSISRVSVETMTEPIQEEWETMFDLEETSETELSPPTSPPRLSPTIPLPPHMTRSQIRPTGESVVRVLADWPTIRRGKSSWSQNQQRSRPQHGAREEKANAPPLERREPPS